MTQIDSQRSNTKRPHLRMLFVHDKGQMCNNIIQYGHVYAWARAHQQRTLSLRFSYKYKYFYISHTRGHNFLIYSIIKILSKLHVLPTVLCEDCYATEEATSQALSSHQIMVVSGWNIRFISLFEKYHEEIIRLFTFDPAIERHVAKVLPKKDENYQTLLLGVHIRRGDYDRVLNGRYFYDDEVYINAIRRFQSLHPQKHIVAVICGNARIHKEAFKQALNDVTFVYPNGNPGEDLCALSHCDYLIGPPSSFSLVASMYHQTPLHFIMKADEEFTQEDFHPFNYNHRHFDNCFYD